MTLVSYLQSLADGTDRPCVGASVLPILRVSWAQQVDWAYWKTAFRELEADHPTVARENRPLDESALPREAASPGAKGLQAIRAMHREILDRLITEIRRRHYSVRTEQTHEM